VLLCSIMLVPKIATIMLKIMPAYNVPNPNTVPPPTRHY